jgi:alpha-L-rhamnosidase
MFVIVKQAILLAAAVISIGLSGCIMGSSSDVSGGACTSSTGGLHAEALRCEYLTDPLGLGERSPRLSWEVVAPGRGRAQSAYRILVASSRENLARSQGDLWDTGRVDSAESSQVAYAGAALASRQACFWKVEVWDTKGGEGTWSQPASWEMGLLEPKDWSGKWVEAKASAGPVDLKILSAKYESVDGKHGKDVTALVAKKVEPEGISLTVNNDTLGGDPAKDAKKHLTVRYALDGKETKVVLKEDEPFNVPAPVVPYLRRDFDLRPDVRSARLYVTALGLYEIRVNGQRVGDHAFAPDWTDYNKRVRYQAYDVTSLVRGGQNVLGALVGPGWYAGHVGFNNIQNRWGKVPALLAQLEVMHLDGSVERVSTDDQWMAHASPILQGDFLKGETYDARLEVPDWATAEVNPEGWSKATVREEKKLIESQVSEPVRAELEVAPKTVVAAGEGKWIFDLGQNMVGIARLRVPRQPSGTKIVLRFAEILNKDGSIYTTNLRAATSTDTYICRGTAEEIWQPKFTFHGFRYIELSGLKDKPSLDTVTGVVLSSANRWVGTFETSDPLVNKLQSNIVWGQRGNYLSVPTDCPQRDERLGWMADAQVFAHTATMNADVSGFMSKWMVDIDDAQRDDGAYYDVAPYVSGCSYGVPAWADAGVIVPWTVYQAYGDKRELEKHLPAMIKWIEWCKKNSDKLIRDKERGNDYGDWLSIDADTSKELVGTAYFAYSTQLVSKSLEATGHAQEAAKYAKLADDIKAAFIAKYVKADGHVEGNTQCAYVLALRFNLLPEKLRPIAADLLEADVKAKGWHLSTGFLGVSYLLPVLTEAGKADVAFRLLKQETFPSWLFSVKQGATTIWERWDGYTPEKGFQNPGMNSFNHYSLGSVGQWLYESVAGISGDPATPGYRHVLIRPYVGGGLTEAKATHHAISGEIESGWKVRGDAFTLRIRIPANVTATVFVPAKGAVTESGRRANSAEGVKFLRTEGDRAVYLVGSGTYEFGSTLP